MENNLHICLDDMYGIDGQSIYFIPECDKKIEKNDAIYSQSTGQFLVCINENEFKIMTNDPSSFIRGIELLKKFKRY